jgi:hypothetical protein
MYMEKKRLTIILATTLSAILLWVSVNMSYEYQIVVPVPLVIENLQPTLAISTPLPNAVHLKLRGNGWRCAALMLGSSRRCILDVNSLPPNRRALTLNDIVDRIPIPLGIQPVDMKPESLFISFDAFAQKRVPVVLETPTTFRQGYGQVGPTVVNPESVTVSGAASLLSTLGSWPTMRLAFDDVKAPIDTDLPLADSASHYLAFTPEVVHVRVDVQQFAEKTVTGLVVEPLGVPSNREVILIPPKIDIVVRGGVGQLAALSVESFRATVDYTVLLSDTTGYASASIASPKGVQLVNKKPDRMQFIIRTRL